MTADHGEQTRTESVRSPEDEDPDQFIAIGRADWFVSKSWNRLHAVPDGAWTSDHRDEITRNWAILENPVRLACGRTAARLFIPGVFTRQAAARCTGCCRATGLPAGRGSPKNDRACRALIGLDAGT